MYSANGIYYTEEYSVSFGDVSSNTFTTLANTWEDWHLIPSSKPAIATPNVITKYIELSGSDGALDLTTFLADRPIFGQRVGKLTFYSTNSGDLNEYIHEKMMALLHGKTLKMRLMHDPLYYYKGLFSVGPLESGASYSTITISYNLEPYKRKINPSGPDDTVDISSLFNQEEIYYTEEYSISFGDLYVPSGASYTDFNAVANTWSTWHLIPTSKPAIAAPGVTTKFVEIPGADGMLDLTTYLTGRPTFGQRQGNITFISANPGPANEIIHSQMVELFHGKRLKMRLMQDPSYYYEGRFSVGPIESGSNYSSITLTYQLDTYKLKINQEGSHGVIWDTFNFETDYDYSVIMSEGVTAGTYYINAGDYAFVPVITYVSGSGTASFGGKTVTMSSAGTATLGPADIGLNTLIVTGTLKVNITWRGGSL